MTTSYKAHCQATATARRHRESVTPDSGVAEILREVLKTTMINELQVVKEK